MSAHAMTDLIIYPLRPSSTSRSPAAVLRDELDAGARHSGASDFPPMCQQPKKQQQKIQENKCSEKAKSPIFNARRPGGYEQ